MPESDDSAPRRPGQPPAPPALPKRFYTLASAEPGEGGFNLVLDGRPARTPARQPLAVPGRALADAIAAEWNEQVDVIDPARMPLTKLANTAIDGVAGQIDAVRADLARYATSDLVCYRAGEPDSLIAAQNEAWDPVLAWSRQELRAQFVMSVGVSFVQQPEIALARIRATLDAEPSPFALAALHVLTTLTGSILIALMHDKGALDVDAAWHAAHVDEHHQERLWGQDYEAAQRREARRAEFGAASRLLGLVRAR
jgi:chaperone required for assembly of F1-ATPase